MKRETSWLEVIAAMACGFLMAVALFAAGLLAGRW
jgi:hypothetical protein